MRQRTKSLLLTAGMVVVIGLTAAAAVEIVKDWRRTPPNPYADLVAPMTGVFIFEPRKDMTAYELALSLQAIWGGVYSGPNLKPWYDRMPPEVSRHWRWIPPDVSSQPSTVPQEAPHPHPH